MVHECAFLPGFFPEVLFSCILVFSVFLGLFYMNFGCLEAYG